MIPIDRLTATTITAITGMRRLDRNAWVLIERICMGPVQIFTILKLSHLPENSVSKKTNENSLWIIDSPRFKELILLKLLLLNGPHNYAQIRVSPNNPPVQGLLSYLATQHVTLVNI